MLVGDDDTLPDSAAIVSLNRWQADRDELLARNQPLGIILTSDQSPDALAGAGGWTRHRDFPAPQGKTFMAQWKARQP